MLDSADFLCASVFANSNALRRSKVFCSSLTVLALSCLTKQLKTTPKFFSSFSARNSCVKAGREEVFDQEAKARVASAFSGLSLPTYFSTVFKDVALPSPANTGKYRAPDASV